MRSAHRHVRRPCARSGFTLIELLIGMAVIGILVTLAAPSFTSFIADQRIKAASFDVMSALTLARSEAIKRNAAAGTTVDLAPVSGNWSNGWTISVPGGNVVLRQEPLRNIAVGCVSGGAAAACSTVSYLGSGRLAGAAPDIQISAASTTTVRCITVDLSGRPSSKAGACS